MINMLEELCNIIAVSGYEETITSFIINRLEKFCNFEISKDNIGNLILHKNETGPKIMFQIHVDEVGFQITKKIEENYYEFKTLGNIKVWNIINQKIKFENNVDGVILSKPNVSKPEKINDLYIYALNAIDIGDVATFSPSYMENTSFYISKSLDNRTSISALIDVLKDIQNKINFNFYCVFSVQEEIGMRGAKVAVSTVKPDIIINIDTSAIGERNNIDIGHGVCIKISDSLGISDRIITKKLIHLCEKNNIKYQREVSDNGTTEMIMVNETDKGSRVAGISIPCGNIHTPYTFVSKQDYIELKKLLLIIFREMNFIINEIPSN